MIKFLIRKGAGMNFEELLHSAVEDENYKMVDLCLNKKIDVNAISPYGETALQVAIKFQKFEVVKYLVDHGADPQGTVWKNIIEYSDKNLIEFLLNKNANPNLKDKEEKTALFYAVEKGVSELIDLLINKGAQINDVKMLLKAVETNNIQVLTTFFNKVNEPSIEASLSLQAAESGNCEILDLLLKRGVNVNFSNENGKTPLFLATQNNHLDAIKLLLCTDEIDVNFASSTSETPILVAAGNKDFEAMNLLLRNQAIKINTANIHGETALLVAAKNQHFSAVKLLVLRGADVNCISNAKETIWEYLQWYYDKNLTDLILSKSNPSLLNRYDKSPLDYAIENEDIDAVQLLLQDKNVCLNTRTWTEAILTQNTELQQILEQKSPCSEQIKKDAFDSLQNRRMKQFDSYWNSLPGNTNVGVHVSSKNDYFITSYYSKNLLRWSMISDTEDNKYKKLHLAVYGGDKTRTQGIIEDGIDLDDVDIYNPIYPLHFAVKDGVLHPELLLKMAVRINRIYTERCIWKLRDMRRYILQRYPLGQKAMRTPKKHKYIYLTKEFE